MREQSQPRCTPRFVLGLVSFGMVIASCAPNGTGAGHQVAQALCTKAVECCSEGEMRAILGPYTTSNDCADRLVTAASTELAGISRTIPGVGAHLDLPNLTYIDQGIAEGRIKTDPDMLRVCTEAINTSTCSAPTTDGGTASLNCQPTDPTKIVCDYKKLFVGQVGEGGHCATGGVISDDIVNECATGLFCLDMGTDGVCVQRGKQGDYCFNDWECIDELYCNQLSGTCQPDRKLGESCAEAGDPANTDAVKIPCAKYLSCDPFARVCVAECSEGAKCTTDAQCDKTNGLRCIVGYCDTVRDENQPCADDTDCGSALRCEANTDPAIAYAKVCVPKLADNAVGCWENADCTSAFCYNGTCRPQVSPPGACPSGLHAQCAGGYCASSGYCVTLQPDGAACQADVECQSRACVSGFCAKPPLANGIPCDSNSDCASNFCNYESQRFCDTKPLDDGKRCALAPAAPTGLYSDCDSGVCLNGLCSRGLPPGADCTPAADKPPCDPALYCDDTLSPRACQPKHGPGEDCTSWVQCYGSPSPFACKNWGGRFICDSTPAPGQLVCDNPPATK